MSSQLMAKRWTTEITTIITQCREQNRVLLVAILYRNSRENEYYNIGDMLLLDVFDRKTGIRYEVFSEPSVETESVIPYRDGFRIDSGNLQYCYVDDSGSIVLEPVDS